MSKVLRLNIITLKITGTENFRLLPSFLVLEKSRGRIEKKIFVFIFTYYYIKKLSAFLNLRLESEKSKLVNTKLNWNILFRNKLNLNSEKKFFYNFCRSRPGRGRIRPGRKSGRAEKKKNSACMNPAGPDPASAGQAEPAFFQH